MEANREQFCLMMRNSEDVGEPRVDPIGQSENRRLFMREDRGDAACGDDGWDADKSSGAQNDVRPERGQRSACGQYSERDTRGVGEIPQRKVATKLSGRDSNEVYPCFLRRLSLHALLAADPDEVGQGTAPLKLIDDSQGRQDMAACAATGNRKPQASIVSDHS